MSKYRTKLLIAMQLCSLVLSTLFVGGTRLAGRFDGDVVVTGNLFKGGNSSKIDQPVDPANKYTQESR